MLLVLQRGRSDCMLSFSGLWTRSSPQNKDWKRQQLTIRYLICAERKKKKGTGWYKSRAPLTQNSPPFFIIIYLWPIRSLYYPSARVVAYVPLITFVPIYFVLPFFLPTSVYTFHSLSLVFLDFVLHKNPAIPADKTKQNKKQKRLLKNAQQVETSRWSMNHDRKWKEKSQLPLQLFGIHFLFLWCHNDGKTRKLREKKRKKRLDRRFVLLVTRRRTKKIKSKIKKNEEGKKWITFDGSGRIDGWCAGQPGEGRFATVEAETIASQRPVDIVVVVTATYARLRIGHGHATQFAQYVGQLRTATGRRSRWRITSSRQSLDPFQRSHRGLRHCPYITQWPINQTSIDQNLLFLFLLYSAAAGLAQVKTNETKRQQQTFEFTKSICFFFLVLPKLIRLHLVRATWRMA